MKVQQLMERVNNFETGRVIAYIKDGLEDLNMNFETHVTTEKIDIAENQRFYDIPNETIKILEVRALNHLNSKDEYRRIPRLVNKPWIPDGDDV
tara:strand:- start:1591 stop:1872 length:282 start_codon:yes stop_codon:yes gene_type:complete